MDKIKKILKTRKVKLLLVLIILIATVTCASVSLGSFLLIRSLSSDDTETEDSSTETTEVGASSAISVTSNPEGAEVYLYANCEDEEYIGTTPFEAEFPTIGTSGCAYYLIFDLSGYSQYTYTLSNEKIVDPISVNLEIDTYMLEKVNLEGHYKFEFLGGIGEVYLEASISEDLSGIEYCDSESDKKVAILTEGDIQETTWQKIAFEKEGRDFTLGFSNDFYELLKSSGISIEGSYWQDKLTLLPDSYILDIPVRDGIKLMSKYSDVSQDWLLLANNGTEYSIIKKEFGGFISSKIGNGLFRIYNEGFIYELDLIEKKLKFIKYVDLRSLAGNIEAYTYPDISGDYIFYEAGNYAGGKSVLTRYNYITGEKKNICEVGLNLARGMGPTDSSGVEKNKAGDKWISLSTFRELDSVVVFDSQLKVLYKSGKKGDSYAQFLSDNEIVFVRYWENQSDYSSDYTTKIVKRNLSTGKETLLIQGYDFYGLSLNHNKDKIIFYDYENESKTEKASIYVVDYSGDNLKKVVDHGVIPYWKDNDTIGYLAVGACTSIPEGHESECIDKKHCYCSLGGGILSDVAYMTGDHHYEVVDI